MQSIDEIIKKYERIKQGKKLLWIPFGEENNKQLLIVMSTHNQGDRYLGLVSFLNNQTCDLLFITDPTNSWYLDDDLGETWKSVLSEYMDKYLPEKITFFGSSMSGYAALFYGLYFDANIIACNPQINLDITKDYAWYDLKKNLCSLKNYINIEKLIHNRNINSAIYILYGKNMMDLVNIKYFFESFPKQLKIFYHHVDLCSHIFFFGRNMKKINFIKDILQQMRNVEVEWNDINNDKLKNYELMEAQRRDTCINILEPDLDFSSKSDTWVNRYKHEHEGNIVNFINCGLYISSGGFSGARCMFKENKWKLLQPSSLSRQNLLCPVDTLNKAVPLKNEEYFCNHWWARISKHDEVVVTGNGKLCEIDIILCTSNNIYIQHSFESLFYNKNIFLSILNKYITFSCDVEISNGAIDIVAGGRDSVGYFHNKVSVSGQIKKNISVIQKYGVSIAESYRDSIFFRVNLVPDKKPKKVIISNVRAVIGYFPMGFCEDKDNIL